VSNGSDDQNGTTFPYDIAQNPAPTPEEGQQFETQKQQLTDAIVQTFMRMLPSNYVSQEKGPWYTLQFQAIAEQFAKFQLVAQDIYKDNDWDFTRPEFLYEILGTLVFPDANERGGWPSIDGDIPYRDFLQAMVLLLLKGTTAEAMQEGAQLLTDAQVELIERYLHADQRNPNGLWTIDNQFEVEINVDGEEAFLEDPFVLQDNTVIVEEALKPAHVIYEYRYLFRDAFGHLFEDESSWEMFQYRYDDLRKSCYGAKSITGTAGETLTDRTLFTDVTRSFESAYIGGTLRMDTGVNAGTYTVTDVRAFPYGDDSTTRAYTTSPTGLTGTATVSGDTIEDTSQDFGAAVEGEVLTFSDGPNAGSYRLETLLGSDGGPVGTAAGPATKVRVSLSMLRVGRRMPEAATGQTYTVDADRLGVRIPKDVAGEDASEQFYL